MSSRLLFIIICTLACSTLSANPPAFAQIIWYVDDDAPNDPGPGDPEVSDPLEDGSAEHPFDVISEGIGAATDGDTVLIADGYYTGDVHGDIRFFGKAITVKSENGPEQCILDCNFNSRGFIFNTGEEMDSILEGLTIRNGSTIGTGGGGIYCVNSSPTIMSNIFENCYSDFGSGGAIHCRGGAPLIAGNVIRENYAFGEFTSGGGIYCQDSSPRIINNQIYGNSCWGSYYNNTSGGGLYFSGSSPELINNLIVDNYANITGGIHSKNGSLNISNCTITGHGNGGVYQFGGTSHSVTDSVIWGNDSYGIGTGGSAPLSVTYCAIQGGWTGVGNFDADPLFATGPDGDYYLGHIAAGQPADSPCINAGSEPAQDVCFTYGGQGYCANWLATRTDLLADEGIVDIGYHYPWSSLYAEMSCVPSWGTIPFNASITIFLHNQSSFVRTVAGGVDAVFADGESLVNIRSGYTNISANEIVGIHWTMSLPDLDLLVGVNRLLLNALDVTAAPFNQPPYPPSGDTSQIACDIHGSRGKTIDGGLTASPASGILPITTEISIELENLTGYERKIAFTIARTLADGSHNPHYRNGYSNIAPFTRESFNWDEFFAEDPSVMGQNLFQLTAVDITPGPYNQPPLPTSGDTDTAQCIFEGFPAAFHTWFVDDDAPNDPGPGDPDLSDPAEDGSTEHPFDSIQEAIDTAAERDFVEVAEGVYTGDGNHDLSYHGKRLTVRSVSGPETCIVDCQGSSANHVRGFLFNEGETEESVLQGFTIRNGWHTGAGGIGCEYASPRIIDCIISENTLEGEYNHGAGISCYYSSPLILNCVISGNTAISAHCRGIGINCFVSSPRIIHCTISNNTASLSGSYAGGIFVTSGDVEISNCIIAENTVNWRGGGMYLSADQATIENCTIVGNSCTGYSAEGGGVSVGWEASTTINNCIIWDNVPDAFSYFEMYPPDVTWSDVQGGFPGTGNIDAGPLFIEGPAGKFYLPQTAAGQLVDSPCLDAGSGLAEGICFPAIDGTICLDELTTRTDLVSDSAQVDMGYHYPVSSSPVGSP